MRDRLVELINNVNVKQDAVYPTNMIMNFADYLIENGVILPPCKVGDTVYFIHRNEILAGIVQSYENGHYVRAWVESYKLNFAIPNIDFGESAFLSKEDAEKALAEKEDNYV